jgi:hypothetical protein
LPCIGNPVDTSAISLKAVGIQKRLKYPPNVLSSLMIFGNSLSSTDSIKEYRFLDSLKSKARLKKAYKTPGNIILKELTIPRLHFHHGCKTNGQNIFRSSGYQIIMHTLTHQIFQYTIFAILFHYFCHRLAFVGF